MPDTNMAVLATLLALAAALQMAIMSECFGTLAPAEPGLARSEPLRFVKSPMHACRWMGPTAAAPCAAAAPRAQHGAKRRGHLRRQGGPCATGKAPGCASYAPLVRKQHSVAEHTQR